MNRADKAMELHDKGFNCAQAVACAFADKVNMPEEDIFRVMEAFGLGMGSMLGTCGAISGAVCIISLMNSVGPENPMNKKKTYQIVKEVTQKFKEKNGATACEDLKGIKTGKVLRSCPDCIKDACYILQDMIGE